MPMFMKVRNFIHPLVVIRPTHFRTISNWTQFIDAQRNDMPLDIHPEIQESLHNKKAIVALEASVLHNHSTDIMISVQKVVRSTGSTPAIIGMIGGRIKVGLTKQELERLADATVIVKISQKDIAPAVAMKADGGTTCSATLMIAAMVGIKVFAMGNLSDIHRSIESPMNLAALYGLTRYPVALVSSGAQLNKDIRKTSGCLEVSGVPYLSCGKALATRSSHSQHSTPGPWNVNDPNTIAEVLHTQWKLGMGTGALIAAYMSQEYESAGESILNSIDRTMAESSSNWAEEQGKWTTPWPLSRTVELEQANAYMSNLVRIENAALIGGQIAVQYQRLVNEQVHSSPDVTPAYLVGTRYKSDSADVLLPPTDLIIIGCAAVDVTAQAFIDTDKALAVHSTAPGTVALSLGGVARNIAEAAHRVTQSKSSNSRPLLVAPVGDDHFGSLLTQETSKFGMRVDGLVKCSKRTAVCNMILDGNGNLIDGIADMDIIKSFSGDTILHCIKKHSPRIIALDGNMSSDTIKTVVEYCIDHDINIFFEPTSVIKSTSIFPAIAASLDKLASGRSPVAFSSPNLLELAQMYKAAQTGGLNLTSHPTWWTVVESFSLGSRFRMDLDQLARRKISDQNGFNATLSFLVDQGIAQMAIHLLPFFQHLVIKCGERGVFVAMRVSGKNSSAWAQRRSNPHERYIIAHGQADEVIVLQHFPAIPIQNVVNVTGAGDSFVGALLASLVEDPNGFREPKRLTDTIFNAQYAATLTLQSQSAVSPLLSKIIS